MHQSLEKIEQYNGLVKTTLKAMVGGTFENWDKHFTQATWLVNTRGYINQACPVQSDPLHTVQGDKVPVVYKRNLLGESVWVFPASNKGNSIQGMLLLQDL